MNDYVIMKPTRTAVIDVGRKCNIQCSFCYYTLQDGDEWVSFEELKKQVNAAADRGNTMIELTGGEPTLLPQILELVNYIHSKGMKISIITNAICSEEKLKQLIKANVDLFRISLHGTSEIYDIITNVKDGRKKQMKFIDILDSDKSIELYHINYILTKDTQENIVEYAKEYSKLKKLTHISFINFNPHYEWGKSNEAYNQVADLKKLEPFLNQAIDIFETNNVGVNLRYYPMCRIREDLRRCVCNDLQVMFDPWEWDYGIMPKTKATYMSYGQKLSNSIEEQEHDCIKCAIKKVCGGINKSFNKITDYTQTTPITEFKGQSDPLFYRKFNIKTLVLPWSGM